MGRAEAFRATGSTEAARADLARYAADMLASLSKLAHSNDMPLLAHLTDLARLEAVRNGRAES
jgi:hypothetical protein